MYGTPGRGSFRFLGTGIAVVAGMGGLAKVWLAEDRLGLLEPGSMIVWRADDMLFFCFSDASRQ